MKLQVETIPGGKKKPRKFHERNRGNLTELRITRGTKKEWSSKTEKETVTA